MPCNDNPQFNPDGQFGPVIQWRSGWRLLLSFLGRIPEEVAASCGLVSPDGDGYWSSGDARTTWECKEIIGLLISSAVEDGFCPPDARAAADAIPDGYIESEISCVALEDVP